jgi:GNAT superfamily N-acetyltransferase
MAWEIVMVGLLPAEAADDTALVAAVAGLVNRVYEQSERGLWVDGAARTSPAEVADLVRAGEIAAAYAGGRLGGVVRVRRLDTGTGEFGMLAADPGLRGRGIGRDLVRWAEDTSRARGLMTMQLELLVPRGWTLASKEFLAAWYTRMGYRLHGTVRIEDVHPHLAPLLATEADVRVYGKRLRPAVPPGDLG